MSEKVQTKVYLPPDVKAMLDADHRDNSEAVEAALVREYGGEKVSAVERQIEEKENQLGLKKSERNEREREIKELKDELQALRAKRNRLEENKERAMNQAVDKVDVVEYNSGVTVRQSQEELESIASKTGISTEKIREEAIRRYKEENNG